MFTQIDEPLTQPWLPVAHSSMSVLKRQSMKVGTMHLLNPLLIILQSQACLS